MRFNFGPLPALDTLAVSPEEAQSRLEKVQAKLPAELRFDQEAREKILAEDAAQRKKVKEHHKMADYRIEIMFGSKRRSRGVTEAKIRVWESAKNLYGDGDVSMSWCAQPACLKPFSAQVFSYGGDVITCPHCYRMSKREQCSAQLLFKKDVKEIITLLTQLFFFLKGNADIVVMWIKRDVRPLESKEDWDPWKELQLKDIEKVVYPYWRIMEDTMHGGSLSLRLKTLIG